MAVLYVISAPYGGSATTTGTTPATITFPIPAGSFGALLIEICGQDASNNFTYAFKNVGVKNVAGTVTIYASSIGNILTGSPLGDLAMVAASATVTGSTNSGIVTVTGVSGVTNWIVAVTYKLGQT